MLLLFSSISGYSQTFSQWFQQKKTQQKYLLEQLTALKLYAGYVKKGYDVAQSGLQTVGDLTHGEFTIHELFISGLKKVNPSIKRNAKVVDIIQLQLSISKAFGSISGNENLSAFDQLYITEVRENLWEESLNDLEELLLVVTSGKVEMSDDERLERLSKVHSAMADKSAFAQHFCTTVRLLAGQRENELRSIQQIFDAYEINE